MVNRLRAQTSKAQPDLGAGCHEDVLHTVGDCCTQFGAKGVPNAIFNLLLVCRLLFCDRTHVREDHNNMTTSEADLNDALFAVH
jgi:hypothetical protein